MLFKNIFMTTQEISIPSDAGINPAPLVASMRRTTNSYKHLFLRSVFNRVVGGECQISFEFLFRDMLAEAWWPAFHYRLSLGNQDKVVNRLQTEIGNPEKLRLRPNDVASYLERLPFDLKGETGTGLLRYVPQRLLSAWFVDELSALPDGKRDAAIIALANERFETVKPLYRIHRDTIEIHPEWFTIIRQYSGIFRGWIDIGWLAFLERKNPHATSLLAKIKPAFDRSPLTKERRIWMAAKKLNMKCIYTNQPLDLDFFAVDHFLPHAFMGHDRFWNLTPVSPVLNLNKSDKIPPQCVVQELALQHANLWRKLPQLSHPEQQILLRMRDDYAADIGIPAPETATEAEMVEAFKATYLPLMGIARRMGFPDWSIPSI